MAHKNKTKKKEEKRRERERELGEVIRLRGKRML